MDSEIKQCQNCKQNFIIETKNFAFYEKIKVPAPTFCPECRFQRRLSWVNLRTLYRRPDFHDPNKNLISMYSSDKSLIIWEDKTWWSDKFDPLNYGRNYDFSRPFFEQFAEFFKSVPLPHLQREYATGINSEYCNGFSQLKNCYLTFAADHLENCSYGYTVENSKDCADISFSRQNELCYEVLNVRNSNHVLFSRDCEDSHNLMFCRDCVSCMHCFGCSNLRNKQYHIFNKSYTKEEYAKKIKEFDLDSYDSFLKIKKEADDFLTNSLARSNHGRHNNNSAGDYVYNSKNTHNVYIVDGCEDVKYSHFLRSLGSSSGTTSSYDYSIFGVNADLVYDSVWVGLGCSNVKFSLWNYGSRNLEYCIGCHNSADLFGCIGVRKGSYCIFNKQYSKEDYLKLKEKITQQMNEMPYVDKKGRSYKYGEFFPVEFSPFAYNETIARDFSTLSKEKALELQYKWKDAEERDLNPDIRYNELPDRISDVKEDILTKTILCKAWDKNSESASHHNCTKVFKITPQELELYRKLNIPLPRYCPNSRFNSRIKEIKPFGFYKRKCQCEGRQSAKNESQSVYTNTITHFHGENPCPNEFETTYSPDRPEIVYCEDCYKAEVV